MHYTTIYYTAKETGDFIGNKIADKITNKSKYLVTDVPAQTKELDHTAENSLKILKERYITIETSETYHRIKYQKIIYFLGNASTQPSTFKTKNCVEMNDNNEGRITQTVKLNLKL